MSALRGEYRAIHVALVDDPDFLELSPAARLSLMTLKLILGISGIDVVRALVPELMALTGHEEATVRAAVEELEAGDWIRVEGRVVWLRNGLRFEPSKPLASDNGRKGIAAHLATLPRVELVNKYARYYGLDLPFPDLDNEGRGGPPPDPLGTPSGPPADPLPKQEKGIREEGIGNTPSSPTRADARGLDRLTEYLGPYAEAATRFAEAADHSPTWPAAILGLYGPSGTDPTIWQRSPPVPEADRPALLARALDRYAGEGHKYDNRYFRRFLEAVIDEHERDGGARANGRRPAAASGGAAPRPAALGAGDPSRRSGWVYE